MDIYKPLLKKGEFLGHGIGPAGYVYEGYEINGETRFFYALDGSEIRDGVMHLDEAERATLQG